jgi:FlaA1/EpsC-like NDP-sugar epimerase
MTRFFMPITEAVWIINQALTSPAHRGMTLTTDKPRSARIGDFIDVCRDLVAPNHPIAHMGARPGEKLHEKLILNDGAMISSDDDRFLMDRDTIENLVRGTLKLNRECVGAP